MSAQPALLIPSEPLSSAPEEQPLPRGAQILIEALIHEGVDSIFGYPGGAVLHIYDELWRARDRIPPYPLRHEQGAVHMGQRYARAPRPGGVSFFTPRPRANKTGTRLPQSHMGS